MTVHAWLNGLVNLPKVMCYVRNFPFFILLKVHVGYCGLATVDTVDTRGLYWSRVRGPLKMEFFRRVVQ
jgi:hypothetical protein